MLSINPEHRINRIREKEKAYHDQCYAVNVLFQPGSWLYKPVKTVMDLLPELPQRDNVKILDLGCGVGRNTIPMAEFVKSQCISGEVVGVDLLESAIEGLHVYSKQFDVENYIRADRSEIEAFVIQEEAYDLIVAVSTLEHLRSVELLKTKLYEIASGMKRNGIVCLIMGSNIQESLEETGEWLSPMFEINLETDEIFALLDETFEGWEMIDRHVKALSYSIERNGQPVQLSSDCLTFTARKKST